MGVTAISVAMNENGRQACSRLGFIRVFFQQSAIVSSRRLMRIADLHKLVESPCARWVGWWVNFGESVWWDFLVGC